MNAILIAIPCAFLAGVVAGGLAGILTSRRQRRSERAVDRDAGAEVLTEADRDQIAAQFTSHVLAVRRSVGEYADLLAGDDEKFRTLLHRLGRGARS